MLLKHFQRRKLAWGSYSYIAILDILNKDEFAFLTVLDEPWVVIHIIWLRGCNKEKTMLEKITRRIYIRKIERWCFWPEKRKTRKFENQFAHLNRSEFSFKGAFRQFMTSVLPMESNHTVTIECYCRLNFTDRQIYIFLRFNTLSVPFSWPHLRNSLMEFL